MDALAREFAGQAYFLFIYVREAHPDTFPDHPAHRTYEQKLQHARDLQQKFNTPRTILVDGLDGEVHRGWGGMPNMSWVIDHTGRVAFKGGWTSTADLRAALEETIRARQMKREGVTTAAYYKETFVYTRNLPPETRAAMTYLRGDRAEDFDAAQAGRRGAPAT